MSTRRDAFSAISSADKRILDVLGITLFFLFGGFPGSDQMAVFAIWSCRISKITEQRRPPHQPIAGNCSGLRSSGQPDTPGRRSPALLPNRYHAFAGPSGSCFRRIRSAFAYISVISAWRQSCASRIFVAHSGKRLRAPFRRLRGISRAASRKNTQRPNPYAEAAADVSILG